MLGLHVPYSYYLVLTSYSLNLFSKKIEYAFDNENQDMLFH